MNTTPPPRTLAGTSHPQVRDRVTQHLQAVDQAIPGLIEMLYLTGSVALDDYRPHASDIDFLAVTSRPLNDDDLPVLARIHARIPSAPYYDGLYLDRATLTATPDDEQIVPHIVNGDFHTDQPCGELNPVLWLTLTRYGIPARGPQPADLPVRVDPQRLRQWNLNNLKTYWQALANRIREVATERGPDATASTDTVTWTVLGPARLHYTLATGDVTSKSGAGAYAAQQFPAWTALTTLARSHRDGNSVTYTMTDAVAAAAMVDAIVTDAWTRWGQPDHAHPAT